MAISITYNNTYCFRIWSAFLDTFILCIRQFVRGTFTQFSVVLFFILLAHVAHVCWNRLTFTQFSCYFSYFWPTWYVFAGIAWRSHSSRVIFHTLSPRGTCLLESLDVHTVLVLFFILLAHHTRNWMRSKATQAPQSTQGRFGLTDEI